MLRQGRGWRRRLCLLLTKPCTAHRVSDQDWGADMVPSHFAQLTTL